MGVPGWGGAIPNRRAIFAVVNERGNGCSTHEVCHVMANNAWGKPERWLDEGLATCSDERTRRDVLRRSFELWQRHELPTLARLARDFLTYPESVSYPAAGSFVRFIHERHGTGKLKELWRGGLDAVPRIFHRSADELEREWHDHLQREAGL